MPLAGAAAGCAVVDHHAPDYGDPGWVFGDTWPERDSWEEFWYDPWGNQIKHKRPRLYDGSSTGPGSTTETIYDSTYHLFPITTQQWLGDSDANPGISALVTSRQFYDVNEAMSDGSGLFGLRAVEGRDGSQRHRHKVCV